MPFTFETGDRSNSTQPGPHVLAGYLTLTGADTGTGYVMAQKAGTASLNFEALKSQTPAYQTYSLKKDQAQWIPILALEPETDYDIYVGVELADESFYLDVLSGTTGKSRAETFPGLTIGLTEPDSVFNEETQKEENYTSRTIKIYPGQNFVFPQWYTYIADLIATIELGNTFYTRYGDNEAIWVSSPFDYQILDEATVPGYLAASVLFTTKETSTGNGIIYYKFNHVTGGNVYWERFIFKFQTP